MERVVIEFLNLCKKLKREYQSKIDELDNETDKNVSANIRKYKLSRSSGNIDLESLSVIIDSLNINQNIDFYRQTLEIINTYSNMVGFEELVKKYQKEFEKLDVEINKKEVKIFKSVSKTAYEVKEYESLIKTIDEISSFYTSKDRILNENDFNSLLEIINNAHDFDIDEKLELVKKAVKINAICMQNSINLESKRQQKVEETKKKERVRKPRNKVVITKKYIVEEKNAEDILTKEQLVIYEKAKEISKQEVSLSENIAAIFNSTQNKTTKDKITLYNTFPSMDDQVNIIAYDLKVNILPQITKLDDSDAIKTEIDGIAEIVKYYEGIVNKKVLIENKTNLDVKAILREFGLEEKIIILTESEKLIEQCKKVIIEHPNDISSIFMDKYNGFKDSYNQFYDVLKEYNPKEDGDYHNFISDFIEIINTYLEEMKMIYSQTIQSFDKTESTNGKDLFEIGKSFYDQTKKTCFYVFLDGDTDEVPIVCDDIKNDKKLNKIPSATEDIMKGLQDFCNDDNPRKYSGRHKAKAADRYSIEFLEKYHVKSFSAGNGYRVFYTRVHSKLNELFGDDIPEVLIVYSAGYGKDGNSYKTELNYDALKRCYDNQKWVDEMVELFSTDISTLDDKERKNYKKKLEDVLRKQYIKMGYFVKQANEKQESGKSKRKES